MNEKVLKVLNIDDICIDAGTQVREAIDEEVVKDYSEKMAEGAKFPCIETVFDGAKNYLTDGFHRYHANRRNGNKTIEALVVTGTVRDARLAARSSNGNHGLRLNNAEKRKSVVFMLEDLEYSDWSDIVIAKHCNVSRSYVNMVRKELEAPKKKTSPKVNNEPSPKDEPDKEPAKTDTVSVLPPDMPADNRAQEALEMLSAENETLTQRLAVAAMDATDEEKAMASTMITDYVEQIRILNIELVSVKNSRDRFQAENSELKKQVANLQRHIKKLENS